MKTKEELVDVVERLGCKAKVEGNIVTIEDNKDLLSITLKIDFDSDRIKEMIAHETLHINLLKWCCAVPIYTQEMLDLLLKSH